jgi:thiol-disulfide isomerase/thioredoxin
LTYGGRILLAAIWCCLVVSCGAEDNGLEPNVIPPPESYSDLFGSVLIDAAGNQVGVESIASVPLVGIFFGAGWCPHCAEFALQLSSLYDELEVAGKPFEVVFVSFDNTANDMAEYLSDSSAPWLAVPFGSVHETALKLRYDVQSIPVLIVVDSDANTISMNGRGEFVTKGASAYDDWLALSGMQ